MEIAAKIEELEASKQQLYGRLAGFIIELVDSGGLSVVLEAGCGSGQLTISLAVRLCRKCKIIAYDLSVGPYKGDLEILKKTAVARGLGVWLRLWRETLRT